MYLNTTEFNKKYFPLPDVLSTFYINIRSLPKHYDNLSEYLSSQNAWFSVVTVSETWLSILNADSFQLPGNYFM